MKKVINFFDKLEDRVRGRLSRKPLIYALIGGIGVILFWRGIWHTADDIPFLTGPVSALLGLIILLATGVFVSAFIGNRLILTGLRGEKKLPDKKIGEIETDEERIKKTLDKIETEVSDIKKDLAN
jgi:hypothetical protein